MACYVFGNPITNSTLEGLPEYAGKTVERKHRAIVAHNMKNAEAKDVRARTYVENLRKESTVEDVFTLCLVYNATGDAIKYVTHKDWHGLVGQAPYPVEIENGQWGAFLHVGYYGSEGGVVYRFDNNDWMISWFNHSKGLNRVYSEIRNVGHFDDNAWPIVQDKLSRAGCVYTNETGEHRESACIGQGDAPVYEAILTTKN